MQTTVPITSVPGLILLHFHGLRYSDSDSDSISLHGSSPFSMPMFDSVLHPYSWAIDRSRFSTLNLPNIPAT